MSVISSEISCVDSAHVVSLDSLEIYLVVCLYPAS